MLVSCILMPWCVYQYIDEVTMNIACESNGRDG